MLKEDNTLPPKDITSRSDLDKSFIDKISRIIRISDNTPTMKYPLVQRLLYNGMKEWGDNMLLGK